MAENIISDANLKDACTDGASPDCIKEIKLALAAKDSYLGYTEYQTSAEAMARLNFDQCTSSDLIEIVLNEEEFNDLWNISQSPPITSSPLSRTQSAFGGF
ncbi:hypothetical protein SRDD_22390 [Serratia sp. DD3]|nr:hypothetical protein [Serratia sp. DD3]KEY58849.1 hypothetical protein SRDD_22390 [Serratia sp. DD3]